MKNNLFNIVESEKKRILEMHENATKKQYLNEQQSTTPASSSRPKSPKFSPMSISEIIFGNDTIKFFKNNSLITFNVSVKLVEDKGTFFVLQVSSKEIPKLSYTFTYDCSKPDVVSYNTSIIPKVNADFISPDLNGVTAEYNGRVLKNEKISLTSGFNKQNVNQLVNLLSNLKKPWNIKNFNDLPQICA